MDIGNYIIRVKMKLRSGRQYIFKEILDESEREQQEQEESIRPSTLFERLSIETPNQTSTMQPLLRMCAQGFGMMIRSLPSILGIIGGLCSLYDLYSISFNQREEKLEVIVKKRWF